LVDDEDAGFGLDTHRDMAFRTGGRARWGVPDADGDLDVDVGLQTADVQVVAIAGYHLPAGSGHGAVVAEVSVGVVDLNDAAGRSGLAAVVDQERHDAAALLLFQLVVENL
jgi:hypothetical protein